MAAAARWQAVERKARLAGNGLLLPRGATPRAAAFRHVPETLCIRTYYLDRVLVPTANGPSYHSHFGSTPVYRTT